MPSPMDVDSLRKSRRKTTSASVPMSWSGPGKNSNMSWSGPEKHQTQPKPGNSHEQRPKPRSTPDQPKPTVHPKPKPTPPPKPVSPPPSHASLVHGVIMYYDNILTNISKPDYDKKFVLLHIHPDKVVAFFKKDADYIKKARPIMEFIESIWKEAFPIVKNMNITKDRLRKIIMKHLHDVTK